MEGIIGTQKKFCPFSSRDPAIEFDSVKGRWGEGKGEGRRERLMDGRVDA